MRARRRWGVILLCVGLAGLEIGHGLIRLGGVRAERRRVLIDRVRDEHAELARGLRTALEGAEEHALFLARSAAVSRVLLEDDPACQRELEGQLLPYLLSFARLDRIRILDPEGHERFRCERIGQGVGALPPALLDASPDPEAVALGREEGVSRSPLRVDAARVEVPASRRQVLDYVTPVRRGAARLGILVLTVYAAPLVEAIAGFRPVSGARAFLVDHGAVISASAEVAAPMLASVDLARILGAHPGEAIGIGEAIYVARPLGSSSPASLLVALPADALAAAVGDWTAEYYWIIGGSAAVASMLAAAAFVLYRSSIREFRMKETERYLGRIREESEKYRALMDGAADLILIVDVDSGTVRESNAMARELVSVAAGTRLDDLAEGASRARIRDTLAEVSVGARRRASASDLRLRGRDGEILVVDGRFSAIDLGEERVVEVSLRDMTHPRELERRLQLAERLSALGLLTAGVAHEINNPLAGIGNYLALLEREGLDEEKRRRYLELVRHGLRRIRDIVHDLSTFARPRLDESDKVALSSVVDRAIALVRYAQEMQDVETVVDVRPIDLAVSGDSGRLEQVFLNLLLNAGKAMAGRGRIDITARRCEAPDEARCEVVVADSGPGIPDEFLDRVFDPFFTGSGGTGLGLAITYGIVRAHGGTLAVANAPAGGARFTLTLPVVE